VSQQITESFTQQYKQTIEMLLQTMGSKLSGAVMTGSYTGIGGRPVNQIGPVVARRLETRHADTQYSDTPQVSRWVEPFDYVWADLVDNADKLRTIIDPTDAYAQNGALALGRAKDSEIVGSFFGSAKLGANGTGTPETFDTTNFQVAEGGVALTVDKLKTAHQKLMSAKNDMNRDQFYLCVNGKQHAALLRDTQAINRDYVGAPVIVEGMITKIMGFNLIHLEELLTTGSDVRLPCWAKSGVHLGTWNDIETKIEQLPTKNYSTQVFLRGSFGATRLQQGKVVEILCLNT